jgi:hypothetical protein
MKPQKFRDVYLSIPIGMHSEIRLKLIESVQISEYTFKNYLSGRTKIPFAVRKVFAEVLEMDMDKLFPEYKETVKKIKLNDK